MIFQLLECPSFYELMACPDFCWENSPLLQIWKQNCDSDGNSNILLESYSPEESISIFTEALSTNTVRYDFLVLKEPDKVIPLLLFCAFFRCHSFSIQLLPSLNGIVQPWGPPRVLLRLSELFVLWPPMCRFFTLKISFNRAFVSILWNHVLKENGRLFWSPFFPNVIPSST